jgi:hypothetical protein
MAIITKVTIDTESAQNSIDDLTSSIEKNRQEQRDLKREMKELGDRTEENALQYDALSEELVVNQSITQDMNKERRQSIQALGVEKGSLADLKIQLRENGKERENINLTTKDGAEQAEKLNAEMLELTELISDQEQASGNFTRSVGNYATAFDEMEESVSAVSPALGKTVGGLKAVGLQMKALLANPLVLMLAALVLVFQSMVTWMERTEEGQEELAAMTAQLSSYFETFLDIVSAVGKYLFSVFIPIVKLLINNFKALYFAGKAVNDVLSGDFDEATKSFEKASKATVESIDNIVEATENAIGNFSTMASEIITAGEAMEGNSQIAKQLARDQADLNKEIRQNTVVESARKLAIAQQTILSRDQTKSIDERRSAVKIANDLELQVLASKKAILEEELRIATVEDSLHDSKFEQKQAIADATAKLIDFETMSVGRQRELLNRKITLDNEEKALNDKNEAEAQKKRDDAKKKEDDAAEAEKKRKEDAEVQRLKELDDLNALNNYKALQKANEITDEMAHAEALVEIEKTKLDQLLADKNLSNDERELATLQSEEAQKAIIKKAEDDISKIRETKAKEEIKRTEDESKARQQAIQGYLQASQNMYDLISQYADEHSIAMKIIAIANATVNTWLGVTQALASGPPPLSFAMAGVALASGLAAVANIVKTKKGSSPTGGSVPSSGGAGGSGNRVDVGAGGRVDNSDVDNQLSQEDALRGAFESMNLSVSVSEITDAQNNIDVAEAQGTLGGN